MGDEKSKAASEPTTTTTTTAAPELDPNAGPFTSDAEGTITGAGETATEDDGEDDEE